MTVLDPSRLHSLVEAIEEIGTLGLDRQRGNPEHSDSRAGMGRISRGHLRLEWAVDTWSLCLPANQEGSGPTTGPRGWQLTWRTQITALVVYWVLLFSACSVFWVDLKTEWGDWRGSCNLCYSWQRGGNQPEQRLELKSGAEKWSLRITWCVCF